MTRSLQGITKEDLSALAAEAAGVLNKGGIILYPTDTLYGLGVNATNSDAIRRLRELKGRSDAKPIHVIVRDLEHADTYAMVTGLAKTLAEKFLPGPLTLILNKKDTIPDVLVGGGKTIGIRIPDHSFCRALSYAFDKPYTTTSANIRGRRTKATVSDILADFGDRAEDISLALDGGELPETLPSTIVDVRGERPELIREGTVSFQDVGNFLKQHFIHNI